MPPKASEKKHFDTTNSDDIKEAFHRFLCFISQSDSGTIKELNEQLDKVANGSLKTQAPETKRHDTMNSDDIKKSFLLISQTVKELDIQLDKSLRPEGPQIIHFDCMNSDDIKDSFLSFSQSIENFDSQLDKFRAGFLRLGHAKGLSYAIENVRKSLKQTREIFFRNAAALVPDLEEQAYREHLPAARRGQISEKFYIRREYFAEGPFDKLHTVLEGLSASINLLHVRTDEFQEFTAEGARLKDLFSSLKITLSYRASCTQDYSDRLNPTMIQRHIHQFIYDLQPDFYKVAAALSDFIAIGIPAIRDEKARAFKYLTNILAASALFSGVTASTLQMSTAVSNPNNTILVVNALWFTSLTLSVGAALNCMLYGAIIYLSDKIKPWISSNSDPGKQPPWITWWMKGSHIILLGASILTFSAGLSVFTFSSNQAIYTPYLIIASMVLASASLGAILIWILYLVAKWQAGAISGLFRGIIAACSKNALELWQPLRKQDHFFSTDVEKVDSELPNDELEKSPSRERDLPDQPNAMAKTQGGVKNVNINRKKKHDPDEINSSAALTELILPDEALAPETIEFECHGTIRDVAYSDDGKWLAVTCAKEKSYESWTTVLNAETLRSIGHTYHKESEIFGDLKWSPSGKKLVVQFERQCDVWDLDTKALDTINIGDMLVDVAWFDVDTKALDTINIGDMLVDVAWFDEDALLVALGPGLVIKKDLKERRPVELYPFQETLIQLISIKRKTNYLTLSTHVVKSEEDFKLVQDGRSEKRIIIYDMEKRETIYQVPFLEGVLDIYWVSGIFDMLITQEDRKAIQLWSLSAGIKDPGSIDVFKKRIAGPEDNIDFACMGGNDHQFIFNVMESGNIDIWRREPVMSYLRFQSPILQKEGVGCYSWRRSDDETATFATAGNQSHVLRIWRGKQVPKTSNSPNLGMNEESRDPSQREVDEVVASSSALSVPPGTKEVEGIPTGSSNMKVDPPNSPEVGPSMSNS